MTEPSHAVTVIRPSGTFATRGMAASVLLESLAQAFQPTDELALDFCQIILPELIPVQLDLNPEVPGY